MLKTIHLDNNIKEIRCVRDRKPEWYVVNYINWEATTMYNTALHANVPIELLEI